MKTTIILLLALLAGGYLYAQQADGFAVQTTVKNGTLEGNYSVKTGVQSYLGIPYAKPPVGDLRWRAPQPADDWAGTRDAKKFGPRAVQKFVYSDMRFRSAGVSEDCLYLNVWTPAKRNTTGLPVLVYFYGGGNRAGDGSELRYDGERMAQEGIVVVTLNYRLGIFGFLAHPELSAETEYGGSGNYGLMDQSAAVRWVHENAAAFGGDPEKITIAGESAGSFGVSMQMASPLTRDLLAGAIGQSGAAMSDWTAGSLKAAEANGLKFQAEAGATSLAELRQLPLRDIYEAMTETELPTTEVVLDGHFLHETPQEIFAAGKQAKVPLLVGWTSAEMGWGPAPESPAAYTEMVKQRYPDNYADYLKYYPADNPHRSQVDLMSDGWIVYGTWKWFDLHRKNSDQPVYRYRFDKVRPPLVGQTRETEPIGAGHASDIEYFLGNIPLADEFAWEADDRKTSDQIVKYLANFIKQGNPNGGDLPNWPSVEKDSQSPSVMILDVEPKVVKYDDARYRFLDGM